MAADRCQDIKRTLRESSKDMNNKGIVDEYRRPKMSYEIVKDIFTSYDDYFETNL